MHIPLSVCMYVSMCVCMYAGKNVCIKYNTLFKTVTASCMHAWEMVLCCPPQSSAEGWACLPPTDLPPSLLCQRKEIHFLPQYFYGKTPGASFILGSFLGHGIPQLRLRPSAPRRRGGLFNFIEITLFMIYLFVQSKSVLFCMCVCMYVCMYVSMYVSKNVHKYIHTYLYVCMYYSRLHNVQYSIV